MADADDIAGGGGSKRPDDPGRSIADRPRGMFRRKGPLRRVILFCALAVCLLLVGVFASTRGPIAVLIAESRIRAALNVDVSVDRARIALNGSVRLFGVTLSVPGHDGIAADFLEVPRVSARIGAGRLASMDLYDPVVRISESRVNGTLNIESIPVPTRRGTPGVFEIPTVRVHGAMIELGEHDATRYRSLARVLADGELTRAPDEGYTVSLIERAGGRASPLRFEGVIVADELEIRTSAIDLSRWPASSMPPSIRGAMELLSLDGVVDSAVFTLTREAGPNLRATVSRVGVTLPFAATDGGPLIRMRDVNGRIELRPRGVEATLDGLFEDLRYTVTLNYDGIDASAPFQAEMRTTNFRLETRPALLPFVPRLVVERLELFSNPTADLDATVTIQRRIDDLGVIGPVEVGGWLQVRNGTASFRDFPYPFQRMEGIVHFDSDRIEIRRLSGRSASGATLFATGVIGPLTDYAEVDVRVEVENAPLDDLMKEALGTRGDIVSQLIDDEHEAELRKRGLLGEGESEFATGGVGDIDVRVRRELGPESIWTTEVRVFFDELRLVPRAFPIPLIARGVLIDVYNNDARVTGESFTSLAGGDAQITIDLDLSGGGASPDVRVGAREAPAGPLLEYAVIHAGAARPGAEEGERAALTRLLGGMHLRGLVDASVSVAERDDGSLGVDAWVDLAGLVAEVGRADRQRGVTLREVNGSVVVTENDAAVDLFARAFRDEQPAGDVSTKAVVRFPRELPDASPEALIEAQMDAVALDLGLPLDRAARIFSPEAGEALGGVIERLRPSGRSDVALRYNSGEEAGPELILRGPERASILSPLGRVEFSGQGGELRVYPGRVLQFDAFDATLSSGGEVAAEVRLDGRYALDGEMETGRGVNARVSDARFESSVFREALVRAFGERAAEEYDTLAPAGRFDALLLISPPAEAEADPIVTGRIEPQRLAFDREGRRVILTEIEGGVDLYERGLRLSGLAFEGVGWSGELAGELRAPADGRARADARLRVNAESLSGDLLAVVPAALRERIEAIGAVIEGPLALDLQEFGVDFDGSESPPFTAAGMLEFDRARAEVGVEVREATGRLAFEFVSETDRPQRFQVDAVASSARLAGISARNINAEILHGARPGSIRLERFSADCHGGRIGASALVEPSAGDRRAYTASIRLSDVRLAPVLAELGTADSPPDGAVALQLGEPPDGSRGLVSAELSLGGWVGTTRGRRGRGVAQIGAGPVLELPLIGRLIEVSNLQLPRSGRFDLAILGFFVENDRVTFDELSIFTESVEVFGYGTMDWPTRELDLRLASRAVRPIPVLSPIVEQFRDELIVARVVGPVESTRIITEPLPGTRDLIRRLLGREPSAEERRLLDLRERMEQNRALARRLGDRARRPEASEPER